MTDYGYHVVLLKYKNDVATSGLCDNDSDADCFRSTGTK